MKILKSSLILCSIFGILHAAKKYRYYLKRSNAAGKPQTGNKHMSIVSDAIKTELHEGNRYSKLTADEVREEFKQRIADGNWLTPEEYIAFMNALNAKRNSYPQHESSAR